jgi:hypothetical protein
MSTSVDVPAEDTVTESPVSGLVHTCFAEKVVLTSSSAPSGDIQTLTRASNEKLIVCPVPQKSGSTSVPTSLKCSWPGGAATS